MLPESFLHWNVEGNRVHDAQALELHPDAVHASTRKCHDVPDLVRVAVFFKPENGRLQVLVRVPSNAFIDFQFPVLDAT